MAVGLSIDVRGLIRTSKRLDRLSGKVDTVLRRTRVTLVRRLPVQARRDIQDEYRLGARTVRSRLRARGALDAVEVIASGRPLMVMSFKGARWPGIDSAGSRKAGSLKRFGAGATWQPRKSGPRELIDGPGAFIARGSGGRLQVFRRDGGARVMRTGRNAGKRKQAIRAVQSDITLADMLRQPGRRARITTYAQSLLASELDRQLRMR